MAARHSIGCALAHNPPATVHRIAPRRARSLRRRLLAADPHCVYCRSPLELRYATLEHLRPLSRGGRHDLANLRLCCRNCNMRRGNLSCWKLLCWTTRVLAVNLSARVR